MSLPLAMLLKRSLDALQLGDDSAVTLGVPVAHVRLGLFVVAFALAGTAVAAAGARLLRRAARPGPRTAARARRRHLTAGAGADRRRPAAVRRPGRTPPRPRHRTARWSSHRARRRPRATCPAPTHRRTTMTTITTVEATTPVAKEATTAVAAEAATSPATPTLRTARPTATAGNPAEPSLPALPALRAESLTLGYGPDRVVVHDLDLDLPAGAVSVIIGANGSGKSTLLARPVATAHPAAWNGLPGRPLGAPDAKPRPRPPASGYSPRDRPPPTASPSATSCGSAGCRTPACGGSGAPQDEAALQQALVATDLLAPRGRARRRTLRWAAPARLAGAGHRPADAGAPARRAHHLPGPCPPARRARAGPHAQPRERPDHRDGPARHQPGLPVCRPPHRDARAARWSRRAAPPTSSLPHSCATSSTCTAAS